MFRPSEDAARFYYFCSVFVSLLGEGVAYASVADKSDSGSVFRASQMSTELRGVLSYGQHYLCAIIVRDSLITGYANRYEEIRCMKRPTPSEAV